MKTLSAAIVLSLVASAGIAAGVPAQAAEPRASQPVTHTGFVKPFAGAKRYERFAPAQVRLSGELNAPLGQERADRIARDIGLRKNKTFTTRQYRQFITGGGVGGTLEAARLIDASVRILTLPKHAPHKHNVDRPRSVLASYGLLVNSDGQLESPANTTAPTREINALLVPGGYLGTWCRNNGAEKSLRQLYRSAYTIEAAYGNKAQQISGAAQLVTNRKSGAKATVGMSMAPAIWIVNFALIYTLSPKDAARMPGWWAPIPKQAAKALKRSPSGQVPYEQYKHLFG